LTNETTLAASRHPFGSVDTDHSRAKVGEKPLPV